MENYMKDTETKCKFLDLRAKGLSYNKISEEIGVSKQTLINWSKDLHQEIVNLKSIELEALCEKYNITKQKRIELFAEKLNAIKLELDQRSLQDVSTDKLWEMLVKYARFLREEMGEKLRDGHVSFAKEEMAPDVDWGSKVEWTA
jgi:transcriptional regulator with XRE-family HTH domain